MLQFLQMVLILVFLLPADFPSEYGHWHCFWRIFWRIFGRVCCKLSITQVHTTGWGEHLLCRLGDFVPLGLGLQRPFSWVWRMLHWHNSGDGWPQCWCQLLRKGICQEKGSGQHWTTNLVLQASDDILGISGVVCQSMIIYYYLNCS